MPAPSPAGPSPRGVKRSRTPDHGGNGLMDGDQDDGTCAWRSFMSSALTMLVDPAACCRFCILSPDRILLVIIGCNILTYIHLFQRTKVVVNVAVPQRHRGQAPTISRPRAPQFKHLKCNLAHYLLHRPGRRLWHRRQIRQHQRRHWSRHFPLSAITPRISSTKRAMSTSRRSLMRRERQRWMLWVTRRVVENTNAGHFAFRIAVQSYSCWPQSAQGY